MEHSDLQKVLDTLKSVGIGHEMITAEVAADRARTDEPDTLAELVRVYRGPDDVARDVGSAVVLVNSSALFFDTNGTYLGIGSDEGDFAFHRRDETARSLYAHGTGHAAR